MTSTEVGAKAAKTQSSVVSAPRIASKRVRRRFRHAPAIAAGVGMVVLWHLIVIGFDVPTYIAPTPLQVLEVFVEQGNILWINFLPTLLEAASGFALGNTIAVLLAVWFVHSGLAERAFYPIAVFINTIPIIAIAPILVLMLGNGYAPKIVIAALICFFPTLVNMVRGLKAVSPQMLELMRVLSANDREVLFKIRLQSSLPFLFAALRIAVDDLRSSAPSSANGSAPTTAWAPSSSRPHTTSVRHCSTPRSSWARAWRWPSSSPPPSSNGRS